MTPHLKLSHPNTGFLSNLSMWSSKRQKGPTKIVGLARKAAGKELVLNPGDYIAADLNGVVCSPKKSAQKVQPLMERQVAADEKFSADIKE